MKWFKLNKIGSIVTALGMESIVRLLFTFGCKKYSDKLRADSDRESRQVGIIFLFIFCAREDFE